MATLVEFAGASPTIGKDVCLAPTAVLIGECASATARTSGSARCCAPTTPTSRSARAARSRTTRDPLREDLPTIVGSTCSWATVPLLEGCVDRRRGARSGWERSSCSARARRGRDDRRRARSSAEGVEIARRDARCRRPRAREEGALRLRPALDGHCGRRSYQELRRDVPDDDDERTEMPEMLIGGEWRQAAASGEIEVVNPATEEVVGQRPARHGGGRRARGRDSQARVPRVVAHGRRERARDPAQGGRPDRRAGEGRRRRADGRAGQAADGGDGRGQPPRPRRALLRRGRDQGARRLPGPAVGVRARLRAGHPPPDGRVRGDHAVQLPAHAAGHEGRAGARRRATPSSPSRRRRRRWRRSRSRGCSPRRACRTACSTSSPAAGRRSATCSSATPTCAASPSPARPRSAAT